MLDDTGSVLVSGKGEIENIGKKVDDGQLNFTEYSVYLNFQFMYIGWLSLHSCFRKTIFHFYANFLKNIHRRLNGSPRAKMTCGCGGQFF